MPKTRLALQTLKLMATRKKKAMTSRFEEVEVSPEQLYVMVSNFHQRNPKHFLVSTIGGLYIAIEMA